MLAIWIVLGVVVLVALYVWSAYNGLVNLKVRMKEAWSDIDVQTRRRYDLVPNLVETVKGYASHESGTFERVVEARNAAMATQGSAAAQGAAENVLSGALKSLFALSENYPELKANQNFLSLQAELSSIETNIQAARRFYNGMVRLMNTRVQQFPSNLIARRFGFEAGEFFEIDDASAAAREPVKVAF